MAMSGEERRLKGLEDRIGYEFADKSLGIRALTHSSYGDGQREVRDYERLEFLGDRVLGFLTAERLFMNRDEPEGTMARRLNAFVRKEACAQVGKEISIGEALLMSPSEDRQGGREKISILGDAVEALMAALYLDGGWEQAKAFYEAYWKPQLSEAPKDPKTELQERAATLRQTPVYQLLERNGPDHRPIFVVSVSVEGVGEAQGTGPSKKQAERFAAKHLLEKWSS
jgi:ribonuclease-3